jgi:hypothetical protein
VSARPRPAPGAWPGSGPPARGSPPRRPGRVAEGRGPLGRPHVEEAEDRVPLDGGVVAQERHRRPEDLGDRPVDRGLAQDRMSAVEDHLRPRAARAAGDLQAGAVFAKRARDGRAPCRRRAGRCCWPWYPRAGSRR